MCNNLNVVKNNTINKVKIFEALTPSVLFTFSPLSIISKWTILV